jgi:hypothetical protein
MVYSEAGPSRPSAAHAAFPSVAIPSPQTIPVPANAIQLWKQIRDARTPQLFADLAALLNVLAPPKSGAEDVTRELVFLDGIDLSSVTDEQIPGLTLGLVYVL